MDGTILGMTEGDSNARWGSWFCQEPEPWTGRGQGEDRDRLRHHRPVNNPSLQPADSQSDLLHSCHQRQGWE